MDIRDISVPEVYKSSSDFRFFIELIAQALTELQYNTENLVDCYDPLRCKSELLWMLAETMGYKLDDRLPTAFNRLVLMYFMSLIRNKGSKDGVTLAAEVNLAQFNILDYGKENDILYDRLEDTSIPVNSVYVTPHPDEGYIDVVYFSTDVPVDSCLEYVRPLGMYMFQSAGVRVDSRSKISVDARLTDKNNLGASIGATHVGHYRREDYARMQKMFHDDETTHTVNTKHTRSKSFYRNSDVEGEPSSRVEPGYRALYSLQLCNNQHIVKSTLKDPIFSLGYGPQDVTTVYDSGYLKKKDEPNWNLRLDKSLERSITPDVYVNEDDRTGDRTTPRPAINPIMAKMGDAISMNPDNAVYTGVNEDGEIVLVDKPSE